MKRGNRDERIAYYVDSFTKADLARMVVEHEDDQERAKNKRALDEVLEVRCLHCGCFP